MTSSSEFHLSWDCLHNQDHIKLFFIKSSPNASMQEGLLAAVVFYVLHRFPNRSILGRGQKVKAFDLGCDPKS